MELKSILLRPYPNSFKALGLYLNSITRSTQGEDIQEHTEDVAIHAGKLPQ